MLELQKVTPDAWRTWRALRLAALREAPYAFASTVAEWQNASEQRWRERLGIPGSCNVIALLDGVPSGMVSGMPAAQQTLELIGMWVAPEARGRGLGRSLIQALRAHAETAGQARIRLEVKPANRAAFALYRRCGFHCAAPADGAVQAPIEMQLSLEPHG